MEKQPNNLEEALQLIETMKKQREESALLNHQEYLRYQRALKREKFLILALEHLRDYDRKEPEIKYLKDDSGEFMISTEMGKIYRLIFETLALNQKFRKEDGEDEPS